VTKNKMANIKHEILIQKEITRFNQTIIANNRIDIIKIKLLRPIAA